MCECDLHWRPPFSVCCCRSVVCVLVFSGELPSVFSVCLMRLCAGRGPKVPARRVFLDVVFRKGWFVDVL